MIYFAAFQLKTSCGVIARASMLIALAVVCSHAELQRTAAFRLRVVRAPLPTIASLGVWPGFRDLTLAATVDQGVVMDVTVVSNTGEGLAA
jgi:hypothetical protein